MTRAPVVRLPNVRRAAKLIAWLSDETNLNLMKSSFNATSRFARLQKIQPKLAGRQVFLRFVATTGDAMGMNMVSKVILSPFKTGVFLKLEWIPHFSR